MGREEKKKWSKGKNLVLLFPLDFEYTKGNLHVSLTYEVDWLEGDCTSLYLMKTKGADALQQKRKSIEVGNRLAV